MSKNKHNIKNMIFTRDGNQTTNIPPNTGDQPNPPVSGNNQPQVNLTIDAGNAFRDALRPGNQNNPHPIIDINSEREKFRKDENVRTKEIIAIGEKFKGLEAHIKRALQEGMSVEDFRKAVIEELTKRANDKFVVDMNFNDKENRQYSILKALRWAAYGNKEDEGYEVEIHRSIEKKLNKQSRGIFIPMQLRAPLTTTTSGQGGGYSVGTVLMDLIEILRNAMMVRAMGATVLSGLTSNVDFPRQTGSATLSWTGENPGSDVADSAATLDKITLSPKTAQASVQYSRQLLQQSSLDVENFVRGDLAAVNALGLDLAAINGLGSSNQPRGILNTTGIGDVPGGTNGLAPAWAHIVQLETLVSVANAALGRLGYLTNAKVRGKLKTTQKIATYGDAMIWGDGNEPGYGMLNGYKAGVSNQVPSNLTKGSSSGICSAIIFGNWADLLIGEFGVMELIVDPYAKKKQGLIEVTSLLMADIAVRHAASFAAMLDALTT